VWALLATRALPGLLLARAAAWWVCLLLVPELGVVVGCVAAGGDLNAFLVWSSMLCWRVSGPTHGMFDQGWGGWSCMAEAWLRVTPTTPVLVTGTGWGLAVSSCRREGCCYWGWRWEQRPSRVVQGGLRCASAVGASLHLLAGCAAAPAPCVALRNGGAQCPCWHTTQHPAVQQGGCDGLERWLEWKGRKGGTVSGGAPRGPPPVCWASPQGLARVPRRQQQLAWLLLRW
jgi:hypothetical protein